MITASEAGKEVLIDALLAEIIPLHSRLRIWKGVALEIDTLTGTADYLIAPLLCAVEAKRDDFEAGEVQ